MTKPLQQPGLRGVFTRRFKIIDLDYLSETDHGDSHAADADCTKR